MWPSVVMSIALRSRDTSSASFTSRRESTMGRRLRTSPPSKVRSVMRGSSRVLTSSGRYSGPAARARALRSTRSSESVERTRGIPEARAATLSGPRRKPVQRSWGGAGAGAGAVMPNTKKSAMRMGSEAIAPLERRQRLDAPSGGATNYAMTVPSAPTSADAKRLTTRVAELERERKHLLAVVEILKELSTSLHFTDILQTIARKLGEAFGLDRCSIFLAERGGETVRLVASYEDPSIRNYVVDLARYPELRRALETGQTVFIPDVASDPALRHARDALASRRVKNITVVPITWRGAPI